MTDLIALAETTARDPLIGAFALMAVGVVVSRLLLKQHDLASYRAGGFSSPTDLAPSPQRYCSL